MTGGQQVGRHFLRRRLARAAGDRHHLRAGRQPDVLRQPLQRERRVVDADDHRAALDPARALQLLGARYSANAYPFDTTYQNCNQWLAELLASAWNGDPAGPTTRPRAQQWLAARGYAPTAVDVGSHLWMFASHFMPWLHAQDHPQDDLFALRYRVSLPVSIEAFVRAQHPQAERIEICHNRQHVVLRRGWEPLDEGCRPGPGDRVVALD